MHPQPPHPDLLHPVVRRAAATVAVPKDTVENSFTLHAPLELLGRVGLLPLVAPQRHGDAIGMIEWLADTYEAAGDPVRPTVRPSTDEVSGLASGLTSAVAAGDLVGVDAHAVALLSRVSAAEAVGMLGDAVAPSLAAAGHAPIGMYQLGRVRPGLSPLLLRGALRSIARRPEWRIDWHASDEPPTTGDPSRLYDVLRELPVLGRPGSDFIFPLMSQVQGDARVVASLRTLLADRFDTAAAARTIARVAAWSMVHDDPEQAPYGWTHALTMPQAVMGLTGAGVQPRTALTVAATFAAGFRTAHGTVPLPERLVPADVPRTDASWTDVATAAALHEDAHLVKFTLAAHWAAADDPAFAHLYLAAAAHLVEWWKADALVA
ncbi:MAG: hypothetical protein ACOYMR_12380 [Ilumatobacteraceae bacterium]